MVEETRGFEGLPREDVVARGSQVKDDSDQGGEITVAERITMSRFPPPPRIFLSNYLLFFHFDKMKNKSKKIIATNNNSSTRNNSIHFIRKKKRRTQQTDVINRKYTQVSYILDNFSRISVGYSALEEIFALTLARCRRTLTLSFARESEVDFRGGEEKKDRKKDSLFFFSPPSSSSSPSFRNEICDPPTSRSRWDKIYELANARSRNRLFHKFKFFKRNFLQLPLEN